MSDLQWSPKDPSEIDSRGIDFVAVLYSGETLTGVTTTVTTVYGVDANPSAIKSGVPTVSGTIAQQLLTGGVDGAAYRIKFAVTTSLGRTLIECATVHVDNCH